MKKPIRVIVLTAVLLALMSLAVFAAGAEDYMTVTPDGSTLTPSGDLVNMSYTGVTPGSYYLVYLVKGTSIAAKADNVVYIDQVTAQGSSVSFDLYPSSWSNGTYTVLLASNDGSGVRSVGTIVYEAPYTLGDVDENGKLSSKDALWALQIGLEKRQATDNQRAAADVTKDGAITSKDALWILQASLEKRVLN